MNYFFKFMKIGLNLCVLNWWIVQLLVNYINQYNSIYVSVYCLTEVIYRLLHRNITMYGYEVGSGQV